MDRCLTHDEVEGLLARTLAPVDLEWALDHLADCQACREALGKQRAEDALVDDLRKAHSDAPTQSQSPSVAQEPVTTMDGYEILGEIHRGGQGVVYKAVQKSTKRTVALKVLLQGPYASPQQRHRFEREIDLVASLHHPNIVTVYESGATSDERQYFAMEYIHGRPLDEYMAAANLSIDETLRLFQKISAAVNYAHQKGIIHRDLKPGNIRIDTEGEPHVLDFGLAKAAGTALHTGMPVTVTGEFMGTLSYASPEQTKGDPNLIDIRTDVYSLGVLLYEMLTGDYPYEVVGQMADILRNIAQAPPKKPSTIRRQINDEVETIVLKALAKERERRYQSAESLARDVEHYLNGEPIDAKRDSGLYVLRKQLRRYRVPVIVAAVFVMLVTGSAIGFCVLWGRSEEQRRVADQRYEEIIRLADLKRLTDAIAAAEELWPAHPENVQAMETWLEERATPLRDNLPRHEAMLASLRARALDYDIRQQEHDRTTHPQAAELAEMKRLLPDVRKELAEAKAEADDEATDEEGPAYIAALTRKITRLETTLGETEQRIIDLQKAVKSRRTWRFTDDRTQWQHDTLAGLVDELKTFLDPDPQKGTLASVQKRLEFARSLEARSMTGPDAQAKWAEATADIAGLSVYRGLRLSPQVGLLPLRRDPRSGLWEFWHIQTGTKPELVTGAADVTGSPWVLSGDTGLVFVLLPGGTFWMGAQKEDPEGHNYDPLASPDEQPVHQITLAPFFLSKYEMTQGQWLRFTGENPSRYGPDFQWFGNPPAAHTLPAEHVVESG